MSELETDFKAARLSEGFDEVAERVWPPDQVVPTHRHPFAVHALVTQGEMWLTVGDRIQHLLAGDEFHLAREEPHAERYGADGATYLAARKH
jgi:quercetin dioxygenase-like cupin family protein